MSNLSTYMYVRNIMKYNFPRLGNTTLGLSHNRGQKSQQRVQPLHSLPVVTMGEHRNPNITVSQFGQYMVSQFGLAVRH